MKKKILLIGAGHHAKVIIDVINKEGKYFIVGLVDSRHQAGTYFCGHEILGRQEEIPTLEKKYDISGYIICVGDNWMRSKIVTQLQELIPKIEFYNAIHPSVEIGSNVKLGNGIVVMPGCIINTEAAVGNHTIINTNSSLEHNCIMEDFSSISAGVTTGGFVILKKFAAIALGVTIFDRITIGKHSVIGSGSLVTKDIPGSVLAYGSPARVVRKREIGEKYLK
ncbi:sugar O-acyltransferase (sialic acid O-acetyltransferase NeuD family) [Gramella sp. Hel_I_59]|uniref:NeuD/PglB/VioB family sugar acetyltransferase n=1 Tax=Gramella sp. Hel_I_59 TaxID=1249978 RepID=UPI00114F7D0F|nr:NeuD/PglB/VioB family sugar acetyltransferase [Gramella sp. Hel_I_59]TQI71950.1 sugar O-acyltransferase (sialic acid O-acetyltransferase NeuD family) [Gramella sp. Hel_I_59]